MRRMIPLVVAGIVACAAATVVVMSGLGCRSPSGQAPTQPAEGLRLRPAAVAGLFYPAGEDELGRTIDELLKEVDQPQLEDVRALIVPHAGYRYSGPTAAFGYRQLAGRDVKAVVIAGSSHYASFKGVCIPDVDGCLTPLGTAMLSPLAGALLREKPFAASPDCKVNRPGWWKQSPMDPPPFGEDTPHTWEHSLEVQIPFLQKVAPRARIVPALFGETEPAEVADALGPHIDDSTILVVSTDLSHYQRYEAAKIIDAACLAAVMRLEADEVQPAHACASGPVKTLLHIARRKGWKPHLLDYRNSGDTAGDKAGVVGYAAVAFCQTPQAPPQPVEAQTQPAEGATRPAGHSPEERKLLLDLARRTLTGVVRDRQLPDIDVAKVIGRAGEKKGCFVTINRKGQLRGCVGNIFPQGPLFAAVVENTINAALRDTRFTPVKPEELPELELEISVLTVPQPLKYATGAEALSQLRPGIDGVVLRAGAYHATYLPQVWKEIPDKEQFMMQLSRKAGLQGLWQGKGFVIETYQAEAFGESEH